MEAVRTLLEIAFAMAVASTVLTLLKTCTDIDIRHPKLTAIINLLATILCVLSGIMAVMAILAAI